jgi:hypothetical protein
MSHLPIVLQNKIYKHYYSSEVLPELLHATRRISVKIQKGTVKDFDNDTVVFFGIHAQSIYKIKRDYREAIAWNLRCISVSSVIR